MYSQTGSETSRSRTSLDWAVSRDKSFLHLAESSVMGPPPERARPWCWVSEPVFRAHHRGRGLRPDREMAAVASVQLVAALMCYRRRR
jgi:hypothetical protein